MTKEMGPSHRIDVLSDAILYYGQKGIDNIGMIVMYVLFDVHCNAKNYQVSRFVRSSIVHKV